MSNLRVQVIRVVCGEGGKNGKMVGSQAIRACVALRDVIKVSVSDVLQLIPVSEQKQT